jgi:nitrite reductase/ring-hydroxylating ferredoxin subunit
VAAAPTEPPAVPPTTEPPAITNASAEIAAATTNTPAADEPPPKRIVQREGMVRGTSSIQAPTHFGLFNLETGKMVDYLLTTSPSLDLRRYKGLHVIVTGEEGLEERWGNTPVITIQKIQVID